MRAILVGVSIAALAARLACAHDIYTGLHDKSGQLCCGGADCAVTTYREHGERYEFLTRENHWVTIPKDRITFLPVPGDDYVTDRINRAHLCYREATDSDSMAGMSGNVMSGEGQSIYLYCAFIPPGAI